MLPFQKQEQIEVCSTDPFILVAIFRSINSSHRSVSASVGDGGEGRRIGDVRRAPDSVLPGEGQCGVLASAREGGEQDRESRRERERRKEVPCS